MGSMDAVDTHGHVNFINRLNTMTAEYAAKTPNFYMHDLAYLAASVGLTTGSLRRCGTLTNMRWTRNISRSFATVLPTLSKACSARTRKAIVLDLDNTLWGGVIGDDGPEGIVLGKETPAGMAYSEFQQYLKELSRLGVLLNVCSKNEEEMAKKRF